MKNKITTICFAAFLSCLFLASTSSAQNACADLKNRTYIAFGETVFDNAAGDKTLQGAFVFKVKFNADGTRGEARFMTAYKADDPRAMQQKMTFDCINTPDGGSQFKLTEKNTGSDNGYFIFKSFDKGARLRVKSYLAPRGTPFWMVEMPAEPRPEPL